MRHHAHVLLIGGLDPSGQAGLARDLAACHDEHVVGLPVATGITAQGSAAMFQPVEPELLQAQLDAVSEVHDVRAAKIGAVFSIEQAHAIHDHLQRHQIPYVLDPVLATTTGHPLMPREVARYLSQGATLSTPNAEEIDAIDATTPHIVTDGACGIRLADGTHLASQAIEAPVLRGTGCRLSARIACHMARGIDATRATVLAHRSLQAELRRDADEDAATGPAAELLRELIDAWPEIMAELRYEHIPEVGSNVAYALPGATDPRRDVVGLAGRIAIAGFDKAVAGRLAIGGPHHTGRICIVLQEYDPDARLVMNHRFDEAFLDAARRGGLVHGAFRREDEPPDAPSSMEWGVRHAIARAGRVPDIIWDRGGDNKEAMIRIIARDPRDLVGKLRILHAVDRPIHDPDRPQRLSAPAV